MRVAHTATPPPIPTASPSTAAAADTSRSTYANNLKMRPLRPGSFCSGCFDGVQSGLKLSDNEVMCDVCACNWFEYADMRHDTKPPTLLPAISLFARRDAASGLILREELEGATTGRPHQLLSSLRSGDALRCCGCIKSDHVGHQVGRFVGYDLRRRLAVVELDSSRLACVPLVLLRRPDDVSITRHGEMLQELLNVGASASTLHCSIQTVKAAHTLCGSQLLKKAQACLDDLNAKARAAAADDEAPLLPPPPRLGTRGGGGHVCAGEAYPSSIGLVNPGEIDEDAKAVCRQQ